MSKETSLKPCPCGGEVRLILEFDGTLDGRSVLCLSCDLQMGSKENAVEEWNKHPMHDIHRLKYIVEESMKVLDCMCNVALDYECIKCEAKRILEDLKNG